MEERKDNPEVLRDGKPISLDEGVYNKCLLLGTTMLRLVVIASW